MKHSKLVPLVFLTFVLAAVLPPVARAGAISPSPAMALVTKDFRESLQVADASSDVSSTSDASSSLSKNGGKSRAKALALSTLLPGAGQYYSGRKGRAKFFFLTESAIWTSFIVFEVQGHLRKDNYINYAGLMAGVDAAGKSEDFYRALGRYVQSDPGPGSYNEDVRREARALYPDDKQQQDQYVQENGYFGKNAWQWQSEEDQAYYRNLRKKSQLAFRRATYMVGVAVANRILSAMDAARSVANPAKPANTSQGLRFEMRTDPDSPEYFMVCLTRSF
ncbi:MAG: hypothetical protein NTX17_06820 [Candidatus Eisenbacteria bacterium]|nr:hypothetical protein [Candidatus Eisenbacteria bacterium]